MIASLEQNRVALIESANPDAAQILAVAILQLRMRLHRIGEDDLKDLCHAMQVQEARSKKPDDVTPKDGRLTGRGSRWPTSVK
jgi:hypothetical protein